MRSPQPISAGSMADIAFLLLIFFMVTTTMQSEIGINRKLPPNVESAGKSLQRNVLNVLINNKDELMVNGQRMSASELEQRAAEFIVNPDNDAELPEKTEMTISPIGQVMVSKQVISLQCDEHTSYGRYVAIQDVLAAAYHQVRDDFSQRSFNIMYVDLIKNKDMERLNAIHQVYPMRISEAEPFKQ